MATPAEEAIQRAKAIAARLSGKEDGLDTSTSSSGGKRKRWGVAPDDVDDSSKRNKPVIEPTKKRIWVSLSKSDKPPSHFVAFLRPRLQSVMDAVQPQAKPDDPEFTIDLDGRGASNKPPTPGVPLEPLHVQLSGSKEAVTQIAEPMVEQLLSEAQEAPLEQLPPAEPSATDGALTVSGYRPKSVAEILGSANLTPAELVAATTQERHQFEETFTIPNGIVGFIIGRGGENITSMQAKTGCRVQLQKETELQPGQTERTVYLKASNQAAISECRALIESMVQERMQASRQATGGDRKSSQIQDALSQGHKLVTVDVPDADIGLIIGKAGATIRSIEERSGASNIQVPPKCNDDNPEVRTVSITHVTEQGANHAKSIIEDILNSRPSYANRQTERQATIEVPIPDNSVGLCIGRGGSVVKHLQSITSTRIQIPSAPAPGASHRIASVSGTPENCNKVKEMIERIVQEQSSSSIMSGTPARGPTTQQQYYSQQDGQQYSAEWATYYAAQAAAQQNQQQQQPYAANASQQTPAPAPTPAAATSSAATNGQTDADTYREQFFRFAYYYGEEAARQYYGAWSPPVGTPNPYGVNPAGIQPAPAAAAPAPAAAQPAAAAPSQPVASSREEAKETSRRKVSNLPAWMTKG